MQLAKTIALLAEGMLWRITHQPWLGRRLIEGLGNSDENARSVAGIMLAKGGAAAIPILHDALVERNHVAEVLAVLGDVGDASVKDEVARFVSDQDETIARAASDALRVLALRQSAGERPR